MRRNKEGKAAKTKKRLKMDLRMLTFLLSVLMRREDHLKYKHLTSLSLFLSYKTSNFGKTPNKTN